MPANSLRRFSPLALTVAAALLPPLAAAQSNVELARELNALKARQAELEARLRQAEQAAAPGMTADQQSELNRITVKTEALEDSRDALGFKGLKISGTMDPSFIVNKDQNRAGFQFLNRVDDDGYNYDNSYFGAVAIDFLKETDSGTRWRLTLVPNRGAGAVFEASTSPIHEASVSIPLNNLATRLIAGQLPDWSGYEYLPPTLNKLTTHNLLFDLTLPTAYTGIGMDILRGKWDYKGMVANMNASKKQPGNKTPVVAYRVDYARGEFQGFGFAGVVGKAANPRADETDVNGALLFPNDAGKDTSLQLFEFDAYFIRGDVTWQGQFSLGSQKGAAGTPDPNTGALRDATWAGLSTLVAYKFDPRLEGVVRLDYIKNDKNGGGLLGYFNDPRNGVGPDPAGNPEVGANRSALTLGFNYLFDLSTTFKAEIRMDQASQPVFLNVKDGTFKKSNQLLGGSVVVSF